jgi:hypothetical protein
VIAETHAFSFVVLIANAIANKRPKNHASRSISPDTLSHPLSSPNYRLAMLVQRFAVESRIAPARKIGCAQLCTWLSDESTPDTSLDPTSAAQGDNRAARAATSGRWWPTFCHPRSPAKHG